MRKRWKIVGGLALGVALLWAGSWVVHGIIANAFVYFPDGCTQDTKLVIGSTTFDKGHTTAVLGDGRYPIMWRNKGRDWFGRLDVDGEFYLTADCEKDELKNGFERLKLYGSEPAKR